MGKYTIFFDVGKALVDVLKQNMVPEPLEKAENIGMCDPTERGNFVVGLHLYDVSVIQEIGLQPPIVLPNGYLQNPPTQYKISFMASVASKAEAAVRSIEEARIMGKLAQVISDTPVLPTEYLPEPLKNSGERMELKILNLELEEKIKIWSMYNEPYKPSIFFEVFPVMMESSVIKPQATRVKSIEIQDQSLGN